MPFATYNIDPRNKDFIAAIIRYNAHGVVSKIDGHELEPTQQFSCAALQEKVLDKPITIQCSVDRWHRFLPSIDGTIGIASVETGNKEVDSLVSYIRHIDYLQVTQQQPFYPPPVLEGIGEESAIRLVNAVNRQYDFSCTYDDGFRVRFGHDIVGLAGALHLPLLKKIILETHLGARFILDYSNQLTIAHWYRCLSLNIETGIEVDPYRVQGLKDEADSDIRQALNQFFMTWKANHYNGDFIPKDEAGFGVIDEIEAQRTEKERLERYIETVRVAQEKRGLAAARENVDSLCFWLCNVLANLDQKQRRQNGAGSDGALAGDLIEKIIEAKEVFLQTPTQETLSQFKIICRTQVDAAIQQIDDAIERSTKHQDYFYQVAPILRKILGVLAGLTLVPALIVEATSKHGYVQTFFGKTPAERTRETLVFSDATHRDFNYLLNKVTANECANTPKLS